MRIKKIVQVVPVILCGGSGTRLWPLSRTSYPKQFLSLFGLKSLFQQTIERLVTSLVSNDFECLSPVVVANEEFRFLVLDQFRELGNIKPTLLLEPKGRNTAPALTIAALELISKGLDPVLVVSPADHAISNDKKFKEAVQKSINIAVNGPIVILGITPDHPNTGYGYIQPDSILNNLGCHSVKRFIEKPSEEIALKIFQSGDYYWNSGIFVLRASVWLDALKKFRPDIATATENSWLKKNIDTYFIRPDNQLFAKIESESIDCAVIEKCPGSNIEIEMVHLESEWTDLGGWDAVHSILPKDSNGNSIVGDVILFNSKNNLVHSSSRMVATLGVSDLFIIETADAVLVMHRDHCKNMRSIVAYLDKQERNEHKFHRKVVRPWGWYDSIDVGNGFQVKRITVKPGASLSLQMHLHRAEHWIVVRGQAQITNGEQIFLLNANQSTYIPKGQKHRLANLGTEQLEIIEVQSGSYLGEDDIVRFEDMYHRN